MSGLLTICLTMSAYASSWAMLSPRSLTPDTLCNTLKDSRCSAPGRTRWPSKSLYYLTLTYYSIRGCSLDESGTPCICSSTSSSSSCSSSSTATVYSCAQVEFLLGVSEPKHTYTYSCSTQSLCCPCMWLVPMLLRRQPAAGARAVRSQVKAVRPFHRIGTNVSVREPCLRHRDVPAVELWCW
jgi:hypothetical protein